MEDRHLLTGGLQVLDLIPITSGFVAEFNQAVDTAVLDSYAAADGTSDSAAVQLIRRSTAVPVHGSLVVEPGNKLRFEATVGALPADTYDLVLRSASDGLRAADGGAILDGEFFGAFPSGDGIPGGDFRYSFTVAVPELLAGSLLDAARAPGPAVNSPAVDDGRPRTIGLPVKLSDAAGATSLAITVAFDPRRVGVSDVQLHPHAPAGSTIPQPANRTEPGRITFLFHTPDPLPPGPVTIASLITGAPALAPYGPAQAFRVTHVELPTIDPPITAAARVPADPDQAADGYVCPLETPPPADFTRLVSSQHGQVFEIFQDPEEDRALWIKSNPQPPTGQVARLAAPRSAAKPSCCPLARSTPSASPTSFWPSSVRPLASAIRKPSLCLRSSRSMNWG